MSLHAARALSVLVLVSLGGMLWRALAPPPPLPPPYVPCMRPVGVTGAVPQAGIVCLSPRGGAQEALRLAEASCRLRRDFSVEPGDELVVAHDVPRPRVQGTTREGRDADTGPTPKRAAAAMGAIREDREAGRGPTQERAAAAMGATREGRGCRVTRQRLAPPALSTLRVRIDLNRASAEELTALPRIGPALAQRIVASRDRAGPFSAVADLARVRGIGPKTVARLRRRVHVRPDRPLPGDVRALGISTPRPSSPRKGREGASGNQ